MKIRGHRVAFILSASLALAGVARAGPPPADPLNVFMRSGKATNGYSVSRYIARYVDLNGDGKKEVVVYIADPDFCGSGGCSLLILQRLGGRFVVRADTTITQPPISILRTRSHGWSDVAVGISGGGIEPGRAALSFNGRRYPSNPTVKPARRLRHDTAESPLISRDDEVRAFRSAP